jgi:trigger factor
MLKLKVQTQDLENRQVQITVEVPGDRLEAAMHTAARRLAGQTRIPGFRPGKAPYEIILARFGEEAVFEEALESLSQETYRKALESAELNPFAPGSLDEVVTRDPLTLRYTVPLQPEIDLGAYRDLRIPYQETAVTDEAVSAFMEELRQAQALIEPADRPAQMSDVVVLDVTGEIPGTDGGEAEPLVRQQGASVLVAEETDWPIPGISQHLLGVKAGEVKELDHTFPEDYPAEGLRGKHAHFRLSCQAVKSRTVPDWSDDLARNAGEFTDLLDLRVKVRKGLEEQAKRKAESDYAEKVLHDVVEGASVSYPPQILQEELDDMLKDLDARLKGQKLSLADYLKVEKKTEAQLREELEPRARERLKRALVLSEVVEAEGLEVADDEVGSQLERMVAEAKDVGPSLRKVLEHPTGRRKIAVDLLTEKSLRRLVSIARGEAPAPPEPATELEPASEGSKQE